MGASADDDDDDGMGDFDARRVFVGTVSDGNVDGMGGTGGIILV